MIALFGRFAFCFFVLVSVAGTPALALVTDSTHQKALSERDAAYRERDAARQERDGAFGRIENQQHALVKWRTIAIAAPVVCFVGGAIAGLAIGTRVKTDFQQQRLSASSKVAVEDSVGVVTDVVRS